MEENNSNNQMSTSNNVNQQVQPTKNNNKVLFVVMALIIVCLAGYIVYTKFIEKEPAKPKDDNTQEQGNNNQQTDNTGKEQEDDSVKISKKIIKFNSDTCENVTETFNNIKVEATVDTGAYACGHKVLVNGHNVLEYVYMISSVEFYNDYVIIAYGDTGSNWIKIVDTKDYEKEYETSVEGYHFPEYISDDKGIVITAHYTEMFEGDYPGSEHAKIRIKYENGKFSSPEIIEKYD